MSFNGTFSLHSSVISDKDESGSIVSFRIVFACCLLSILNEIGGVIISVQELVPVSVVVSMDYILLM